MKKNILIFIILYFISSFFLSCNKYEDGPAISLLSAKKRLAGTYNLEQQLIDDEEITIYDMETVTYDKNGNGKRTIKLAIGTTYVSEFEWEFDKKKEHLRDREKGLDGTWGEWTPYKKILRLTKKELWLLDSTSKEIIEYHYKKE